MKPQPESPEAIVEARIQAVLREQTRELDLSELGLTSLPESLGKLTSLRRLVLHLNQLTNLPKSLSKLTSLQTLDLTRNQFTSLPESLGNLTNLRTLGLQFSRHH